jgi:ribosomal protein L19E
MLAFSAEVLADPDAVIVAAVCQILASVERPATVLSWIKQEHTITVLGGIGKGKLPLAHETLDRLPAAKTVEHLRSVLVATGALPVRDEHMVRLERWLSDTVAARTDPDERYILKRYALWHSLRRLRRRRQGEPITYNQAGIIQANVRAAIELLDWLTQRGLTLRTADQGHLDIWLAGEGATRRGNAGNFIRWAAAQKITPAGAARHSLERPQREHRRRQTLGASPLAATRRLGIP